MADNNRVKLKLCGLTREEDIRQVNLLCPDYIGFVFAPSRRQVTLSQAARLKALLHPEIQAVGVFVNQPVETMLRCVEEGIIDLVQLHGDEGEETIRQLKNSMSNPVIKVVRVQNSEQILKAAELPCDYLLLDTYSPHHYGGGGERFDWKLIPTGLPPFFLAGGLHAGNLLEAAQSASPYCLDLSSGVETQGKKDGEKMEQVCRLLNKYNDRPGSGEGSFDRKGSLQ